MAAKAPSARPPSQDRLALTVPPRARVSLYSSIMTTCISLLSTSLTKVCSRTCGGGGENI